MFKKKFVLKLLSEYGFDKQKIKNESVDSNYNPIPWYTYPAIEYLSQFDFSNKTIFEFSAGNSSLWWAQRCREIVSVENDYFWYKKIKDIKKDNMSLLYCDSSESYANSIFDFERQFDIIIIDGYWRDLCAKNAINCIKPNGMIILDNSERVVGFEEYRKAIDYINSLGFIQVDFKGMGPINSYTWCTSIFVSRQIELTKVTEYIPTRCIGGIIENDKD